jgi:hypothetical protein
MLSQDHEKRCDYIVGFQLEQFKDILKAKPYLYQSCHTKLANFIASFLISDKSLGRETIENDQTSVTLNTTTSDTLGLKRFATPENINFENNIFFQQYDQSRSVARNLTRDNSSKINLGKQPDLLGRSGSFNKKSPS